jgi:hypothetical protein
MMVLGLPEIYWDEQLLKYEWVELWRGKRISDKAVSKWNIPPPPETSREPLPAISIFPNLYEIV